MDGSGSAESSGSAEPSSGSMAPAQSQFQINTASAVVLVAESGDCRSGAVGLAVDLYRPASPQHGDAAAEWGACESLLDLASPPAEAFDDPRGSTLAPLCHDVLAVIIAEWCDEPGARAAMATCRTLRFFCLAMDALIWRPKCLAEWHGKAIFGALDNVVGPVSFAGLPAYPMLLLDPATSDARRRLALDIDDEDDHAGNRGTTFRVAHSTIPSSLAAPLLRAVRFAKSPPPAHMQRALAHSWRAALHVARKDQTRDFLTDDEVFEHRWAVEFRRRPAGLPTQETAEAKFTREGLVKRVQPAPFLPSVPWQLYDGGRKVQVDVYPAHVVKRLEDTWGWSIENAFVRFYSVLRPP